MPGTHDAEDGWLVRWARAGDAEAFEVLIARHQDRIFRIALRMLGNRHDAEDVMQDVLVQLWTGWRGSRARVRSRPGCTASWSTAA